MADKIKFVLALLVLAAGVVGFYLLAEQPAIVRVLCVLAGAGAGAAIAAYTESGRRFFAFWREAVIEARKVVWPSRRETLQMTGAVFAFVLVMALMLWMTDKTLEWVLYDLVLGWKQ
ncbi:MAG: preprotein translocase subunit SecE [Proteobacteria bacterium]|nr:preprotein translocase subunit SecE [Pseudomonadota bacterium]